jgi:hypothetical protein
VPDGLARRQQHRKHGIEQMQGAAIVHGQVALHLGQVELRGALGLVAACAIEHQVGSLAAMNLHGPGCCSQGSGVGHVQRQGQTAVVAAHEILQASPWRAETINLAPCLCSASAVARPMPEEAPRIQAERPCQSRSGGFSRAQSSDMIITP